MSELKPCPFCGGKAVHLDDENIYCYYCGATFLLDDFIYRGEAEDYEEARQMAIEAWNRRVDDKVGKWAEDVDGAYICSACGCYDYEASKYCPNCGAKMEDEDG